MGDIGTHAATLAEYISGDLVAEVCADLTIFVEGRRLDDDGSVLIRMAGWGQGCVDRQPGLAAEEENNLNIRLYGESGGLEWRQQEPNTLWLKRQGEPARRLRAGVDPGYLGAAAQAHMRTPSGHPEGYFDAFANIYRNFAFAIRAPRCRRAARLPPRLSNDRGGRLGTRIHRRDLFATTTAARSGRKCRGIDRNKTNKEQIGEQQMNYERHDRAGR